VRSERRIHERSGPLRDEPPTRRDTRWARRDVGWMCEPDRIPCWVLLGLLGGVVVIVSRGVDQAVASS